MACDKSYHQDYYQKNKEKWLDRQRRKRKESHEWLCEYKSDRGCKQCGEKHPACLDFHHLGDKKDKVSRMARNKFNRDKLLDEISKCEILCANCHRKLHWV